MPPNNVSYVLPPELPPEVAIWIYPVLFAELVLIVAVLAVCRWSWERFKQWRRARR